MKRSTFGWIAAFVLALVGAAFAYLFVFAGGSGEPSTDLTTPEFTGTTATPNPSSTAGEQSPAPTTFVIDQSETTASFEVGEELQGNPQQVIGTTDQVVGQVRFDPSDLTTVELSDVLINARTFSTDSERRDRAIRGPVILDSGSDANELITFAVRSIDGLEGSVQVGQTADFAVVGDLTIKGNTRPVTFDASVTLVDAGTISGSATASVTRDMFEIGIPNVPGVANVTDVVEIKLEFVARSG